MYSITTSKISNERVQETILELFQGSLWFSRVWVLQEVPLADTRHLWTHYTYHGLVLERGWPSMPTLCEDQITCTVGTICHRLGYASNESFGHPSISKLPGLFAATYTFRESWTIDHMNTVNKARKDGFSILDWESNGKLHYIYGSDPELSLAIVRDRTD